MRQTIESQTTFARPLLFAMGSPAECEDFVADRWPGASCVSDPDRWFYEAFRIRRARLTQLFGPSVWTAGVRAWKKGHRQGKRQAGDVRTLPGLIVIRGRSILWECDIEHVGDHPTVERTIQHLEMAAAR